jgi:hypothetical protein
MLWWMTDIGIPKKPSCFKQEAPPSTRWSSSLKKYLIKNKKLK